MIKELAFGIVVAFLGQYIFSNTAGKYYENFLSYSNKISNENVERYCKSIMGGSSIDTILLNHLYLGNICAASKFSHLGSRNIDFVLNTARESPNYFDNVTNLELFLLGDGTDKIPKEDFHSSREFINRAKEYGKGVLVYSARGADRSATITIAYLMQEKKWRLKEAYEFVAKKRPMIQPNGGFLLQLEGLEKEIFGKVSPDTKDFIRKTRSDLTVA